MPTATRSFPATQPIDPPTSSRTRVLAGLDSTPTRGRPRAAEAAPARQAATPAPAAPERLPGWARGVVIGGVLLAIGMPACVLLSRSMLEQEAMMEQSSSQAAMVCTAGEGRALDSSSVIGWLFGGSYFHCGDWETREARQQRDRDRDQANFLARERARQQY
ncbi:hypothetical protein [Pelomonas cellulosilytica]|uniref:Transmembrane protein n=1 Tax=Pelomonas cellulosilytica TaxID=2906762 RepID=A0ABS8XPT7_9BURK|nr:hypothetical protein [Pelomonas sp. P8]MCE4554764.1 hypothetical protein [Pelomonas sp. P8]